MKIGSLMLAPLNILKVDLNVYLLRRDALIETIRAATESLENNDKRITGLEHAIDLLQEESNKV